MTPRAIQRPSTFTKSAERRGRLSWWMLQVMVVEVAQSGVNYLTIISTTVKSRCLLVLSNVVT